MTLVGIGAQKLELASSWPELGLIVILLLVMIYIVVKVSIIIRWCFYWYVCLCVCCMCFTVVQLPQDNFPKRKLRIVAIYACP